MKRSWAREAISIMNMSIKSYYQLTKGYAKLLQLQFPLVTIFGGKGAYEEGDYAAAAQELSQKLVETGCSILTGGGPGIMTAASCGAEKATQGKSTLGITVKGMDRGYENPCAPVYTVDELWVRKWLLLRYTSGFIVFPGGIGTLDELFELLDNCKNGLMKPIPIWLINTTYWKHITDWYEMAVEKDFIGHPYQELFQVTDDIDEAFQAFRAHLKDQS